MFHVKQIALLAGGETSRKGDRMRRITMEGNVKMYIALSKDLARYTRKLDSLDWVCSYRTPTEHKYNDYVLMCYPALKKYQVVSPDTALYILSLELADNKI